MPAPSAPTSLALSESAILYAFTGLGTFRLSNKAAALLTWTNNAPTTAQHRLEWSIDGTTWRLGEAATFTLTGSQRAYLGTNLRATIGASIATIGAASMLVVNLPLSTTIHFRLKAQDEGGDSTYATLDHTTAALATTGSPPTVPSGFAAATPTAREIALTWEDASTNEAFFEIEAQMDTDYGRVAQSWFADGTIEALTIDVQARFASYFDRTGNRSVASRFVDVRIRAVGGAGTAAHRPTVASVWTDFLTLVMAPPEIFVTYPAASIISIEKGAAYSLTIVTNTPATSWSVDALPAGLTLTDNVIDGTPTTTGTTTSTITVDDGSTTSDKVIDFIVTASSLQFTSPAEVTGRLGVAFTYTPRARILSGGLIAITYTAPDLPGFLTLEDGVITGTPTESGEFTFVVTATTARATNSMVVKLTVAALAIATDAALSAAIGQEFRLALVSVPAGADFELIGGPDWLAIEDNVLIGTPPDEALDTELTFDLAATLETESTTKSITLAVGPLFTVSATIEAALGRHLLEHVTYNGAGRVTDWWLSNAPAGLELWDYAMPDDWAVGWPYGGAPTPITSRRAIRGEPTASGLFKATISVQVLRAGAFETFSVDVPIYVEGNLFLPWFHVDPYALDLQVPLRGDISRRGVRSYYETAATPASTSATTAGDTVTTTTTPAVEGNLLTLKRGDQAALGIIFRDGVATTVEEVSDVLFTLREKDAEDGEYVFKVAGEAADLDGHGYFTVGFLVDADQLTDTFGDDSITSMQLLGEISYKHAGDARSSATFVVTIVEDIER